MKKFFRLILIFFFILNIGFVSISLAQMQTGSIYGTIYDDQQNPLPGATITVTSEALMGTKSYVSSETGSYRFPSLPPGIYTIIVEMSGFKKIARENIIVRVGVAVAVNFSMEPATLEEEITVTASAPTIDVKQSKVAVTVSRDLIEGVPIARTVTDLITFAPGALLAETQPGGDPEGKGTVSFHGVSVRATSISFDGANMYDSVNGSVMNTLNIDAMEEIEMITAALPPAAGVNEGAYINIVTRSGGNRFSGGALIYYTNEDMAKSMWPDETAMSMKVTQPSVSKSWADAAGSIGGPIFKDKLWFYSSFRYINELRSSSFIPFTDIFGRRHEGKDWKSKQEFGFLKLSFQISPKLKLQGLLNYVYVNEPGGTIYPYQPFESTQSYKRNEYTVNGIINYILNQNTFFDVKFTYIYNHFPFLMQPEVANLPNITDYATPYGSITNARMNEIYSRKSYQAAASFTSFMDNVLGGNHEIKAGLDGEVAQYFWDAFRKDPMFLYYNDGPYFFDPVARYGLVEFSFYPPNEGQLLFAPKVKRIGFYLQDSITFSRKLTLSLGFRSDYYNGWVPAFDKPAVGTPLALWIGQNVMKPYVAATYPKDFPNGLDILGYNGSAEWSDIMTWFTFSPRIGLTYDVFGNGKTALKASYSRYASYLRMELYSAAHPFCPAWGEGFQFDWYDTNANQTPDIGDVFKPFPMDLRRFDINFAKKIINPDTKSPVTDEMTFGIWQELFKDFSLGASFVYKDQKNITEDGLYDPDKNVYWYHPDQAAFKEYTVPFTTIVPGTDEYPDQEVTVYARKSNAPETFRKFDNIPELKRKYWGLELIFNKRMSNRWQLAGSFVFSKAYGNMNSSWGGGTWGWSSPANNENWFVNRYGRTDVDRPIIIKIMGTVVLPFGINLSGYLQHYDGQPWTRTVSIRPPQDWLSKNNAFVPGNYATVNLEPLGSRRYKSSSTLDLRLEKEFGIGEFGRLGAYIDVFNILGWSNVVVGQNDIWRYSPSKPNSSEPNKVVLSPSYGLISKVEGLRVIKVSVRFRF